MNGKSRRKKYEKEESLEHILEKVNERLSAVETDLLSSFERPKLPIIFIVGAQRSGTTLLMQLLIQKFKVGYPSNFTARFWSCPYIGAKIYESFDLSQDKKSFTSDLGYTKGLNGPHEFGYFWKQWFPWLAYEENKYDEIDYSQLKRELAAWQSINQRPLLFKNLIYLTGHIQKLHKLFPTAFFINIKRTPVYNIQSTYLSRLKLFNSEKEWFGIKPSKYSELKDMPIDQQIAGQVYHIRKEIQDQLQEIPSSKYVNISYESLITNPKEFLNHIENSLLRQYAKKGDINVPNQFPNENKRKIDKDLFDRFQSVYQKFLG